MTGLTVVPDIKSNVSMTISQNPAWTGYNQIDDSLYVKLATPTGLCTENTLFCSGLLKLNLVNDIKIDNIPPSNNGRYTMEFWTMNTSVTSLTSGYHVIWKN